MAGHLVRGKDNIHHRIRAPSAGILLELFSRIYKKKRNRSDILADPVSREKDVLLLFSHTWLDQKYFFNSLNQN